MTSIRSRAWDIAGTVCLALILAASPLPASAAEDGSGPKQPVKPVETDPIKRLDNLFSELKRERNEKAAERIAARIWNEWNHSTSASVDLMMQWSQKAIEEKKVTVIDVNGSKSFEKGHIPGAIDFASQKAELAKALPADKNALVVT